MSKIDFNRLTKDDNGVITEYTYDDNDRLLTENGYAYTYDNNGNMLTKNGNGETWQLEYNALNQLVHANISTPQGSSTVDYAYDHDGIRIGKTINGTDVMQYVVDKNRPYAQVLEEERTNGMLSATMSYVYGDALISSTTEGMTHYYHADGMGSVRGLSDMNGDLTDTYAYDAYGMLQNHSGASENPYRYRGEQYDADLDSYYLRARYYQPGLGRFLTTDTEEGFETAPLSLHRYIYGSDDPINNIDPSGRMTLNEQLTVGTIIGNLSVIAVGSALEERYGFYSKLGEWLFPDAYILGIYGTFSVRVLQHFLTLTSGYLNSTNIQHLIINGLGSAGLELVLNIPSAQAGLFFVGSPGGQVATTTTFRLPKGRTSRGWGAYQGYVWNLWSVDDYEGHFASFGTGREHYSLRTSAFKTFFDPTRPFIKGPWGISRTLFEKKTAGISLNYDHYPRAYEYSYYLLLGPPIDFQTEAIVGAGAMALSIAANLWQARMDPLAWGNKGFVCIEPSIWLQTTIAKYFWNMKSQYNREYRQRYSQDRPDDFVSGPSLAIWSYFGG